MRHLQPHRLQNADGIVPRDYLAASEAIVESSSGRAIGVFDANYTFQLVEGQARLLRQVNQAKKGP